MIEEQKQKEMKKKKAVGTRGRIFKGRVIKVFPTRAVMESERSVYLKKYERFFKRKTKIHARIPEGMKLEMGDIIKVRECRPLSKIIHHKVIEKLGGKLE